MNGGAAECGRSVTWDRSAAKTIAALGDAWGNVVDGRRRGIKSIEVGGRLLLALGQSRSPMALKDLAREAGMTAAKAHPYLVSFGKMQLIEQDPVTGRYDLGRQSLRLGLTAIQRLDAVRIATEELGRLSAGRHSTAIAVWGNLGPTIVRFEEADYPLHVYLRNGTVLSLANTAIGLVFSAYMPEKLIEEMLKTDRNRFAGRPKPVAQGAFRDAVRGVRRHGLARNVGIVVPGVNSISAPVFDHEKKIVLAVSIMGPGVPADADWESPMARTIAGCAQTISHRLGYGP